MREPAEDCHFPSAKAILGCSVPKLAGCFLFSLAFDLCMATLNTICSDAKVFRSFWCTIRTLECLPLGVSAKGL